MTDTFCEKKKKFKNTLSDYVMYVRAQVTTKVVIAVMASSTSAHAIWLHLLSY